MEEIINMLSCRSIKKGKSVIINEDALDLDFSTDSTLLKRVLTNMIKNALEASPQNEQVTVNTYLNQDKLVFSVHNNTFIPHTVQLQLFQRSFSTKGKGRGIGTYSMKLFGERYLKGKVWFTSTENEGTYFYIEIPINFQ